ncbi:MAG: hypothetical protein ACOCRX_08565, partial [Candidatus Woesearchaeota archaeon]
GLGRMSKDSNQTDVYGNKLYNKDEITFTYDGSSFEGKMELPKLTAQLQSTEILIKELVNELYRQKKLNNSQSTKVYLELKRGSFQEIISIIFNHPFAISVVGGSIVAIVNKLLDRKKDKSEINIDHISNNYGVINNINLIVNPLQKKGDKLTISLPDSTKEEIAYEDKDKISQSINELQQEDESSFEVVEEEFFGNLNSVNIKQGKFGFILEGTNKVIPVSFDEKPNLSEIKEILAERVKIKARATTENGELRKLDILDYEIKKRKVLSEYFKNSSK